METLMRRPPLCVRLGLRFLRAHAHARISIRPPLGAAIGRDLHPLGAQLKAHLRFPIADRKRRFRRQSSRSTADCRLPTAGGPLKAKREAQSAQVDSRRQTVGRRKLIRRASHSLLLSLWKQCCSLPLLLLLLPLLPRCHKAEGPVCARKAARPTTIMSRAADRRLTPQRATMTTISASRLLSGRLSQVAKLRAAQEHFQSQAFAGFSQRARADEY